MSQKVRLVRSVLRPPSLAINIASNFSDASSINVSFKKFSKLMVMYVQGSLHFSLIEITNKMRPCSRIYYSNVS